MTTTTGTHMTQRAWAWLRGLALSLGLMGMLGWSPQLALAATAVNLSSPGNGTAFAAPGTIRMVAVVGNPNTPISKVEFYNNNTRLYTSVRAPYTFTWTRVPVGNYTLTAKAYDATGFPTSSAEVAVRVVVATNAPPTVSLTSPQPGARLAAPATVALAAIAADTNGSVSKVEFYNGSSLLGTSTTAPYGFNWEGVPAGTYTVSAKAYDNLDAATISAAVVVRVGAVGAAPAVQLTSPQPGANLLAPATVSIVATPVDPNVQPTKVEFYNGSTRLFTRTAPPFAVVWKNVQPGSYTLSAKAYDRQNVAATSAAVAITVANRVNVPPTVSLTSPAAGASLTAPARVQLAANAADADGSINRVEYYNGTTLLGTSTAAPFAFSWTNVAVGSYSITARAYDNQSAVSTSAAVSITVRGAPTVSVISPFADVTMSAGGTFTLRARVDGDVQVSRVEYYDGGSTLLATRTVAPYDFNWSNIPAGIHRITAVAFEAVGNTAMPSTPRLITAVANAQPNVSVALADPNARMLAPATVALAASASDTDGSVAKVEFYNGATLLGTRTAAPFNFSWVGVAVGSYTVSAKAYDNQNAVTTSAPLAVTVVAPNTPPTVSLSLADGGASYFAPATVQLAANAADADGSVSKVEFYNGNTLLGTSTAAPFAYRWPSVTAGSYTVTAKAYDNQGAIATSTSLGIIVGQPNAPPVVSLFTPAANAQYTAPSAVLIQAIVSDPNGSISKVEFYSGSTLLATRTAAPYAYTWPGVAAGSYTVTAKAYDNLNAVTTSAPVAITVVAPVVAATNLYFIHPDHLDTPRQVSDANGKVVWQWEEQEPFGLIPPLEDPDADGAAFVLNLRFAGQYFDAESRLHYNGWRDYDSGTGRYVQADPIGLAGGASLYQYVSGNPLSFVDPLGLAEQCGDPSAAKGVGPLAGGGAKLENLTAQEIARIQNAANRTGTPVSVVGSRANGTARATSDWDYVVPETTRNRTVHSLRSSLPEGPRGLGEPRNQDFFKSTVDPNKPFITFAPK